MLKTEIIGHLGADVEIKDVDGHKFAACRVAHSESYKDAQGNKVEKTQWIDVTLAPDSPVLPFLKKGTMIYARGGLSLRAYSSPQEKCWKAGASIRATEIQLLSSQKQEDQQESQEQNMNNYAGY